MITVNVTAAKYIVQYYCKKCDRTHVHRLTLCDKDIDKDAYKCMWCGTIKFVSK